jgi:Tol biopolymer transport system component
VDLPTRGQSIRARVSTDGRWLAYSSDESGQGRTEIHVVGLPNGYNKVQISTTGGDFPRWRRDGKEIFYLTPDRVLMAAAVKSEGPSLQVGNIERLFEIQPRLGVGVGGAASLSG